MKKKTLYLINKNDFPACLQPYANDLRGICVGGCIDPRVIKFRGAAHAHVVKTDICRNWICLQYRYQLKERYTLLHEMAHILVSNFDSEPQIPNPDWEQMCHGKEWQRKLKEIGGTVKPVLTKGRKKDPDFYHGYRPDGQAYVPSNRWIYKNFHVITEGSITKLRLKKNAKVR